MRGGRDGSSGVACATAGSLALLAALSFASPAPARELWRSGEHALDLTGPAPHPEIRNVLLISLDTTRADHLGCYGYPGPITPNIDAIADEGVVFDNVVAPVPLTLPSHVSMLTGLIPPVHGVRDNLFLGLGSQHETLAETLGRRGLTTGAIVSAVVSV